MGFFLLVLIFGIVLLEAGVLALGLILLGAVATVALGVLAAFDDTPAGSAAHLVREPRQHHLPR